jgi:hypothetical protein
VVIGALEKALPTPAASSKQLSSADGKRMRKTVKS